MKENIKIILAIVVIVIVGIIVKFSPTQKLEETTQHTEQTPTEQTISAQFSCKDGNIITSVFHNGEMNSVDLQLSDGRTFSLPQVISASGARYANQDESFVFWNKGNTAFITENNTETFSDCITN